MVVQQCSIALHGSWDACWYACCGQNRVLKNRPVGPPYHRARAGRGAPSRRGPNTGLAGLIEYCPNFSFEGDTIEATTTAKNARPSTVLSCWQSQCPLVQWTAATAAPCSAANRCTVCMCLRRGRGRRLDAITPRRGRLSWCAKARPRRRSWARPTGHDPKRQRCSPPLCPVSPCMRRTEGGPITTAHVTITPVTR